MMFPCIVLPSELRKSVPCYENLCSQRQEGKCTHYFAPLLSLKLPEMSVCSSCDMMLLLGSQPSPGLLVQSVSSM